MIKQTVIAISTIGMMTLAGAALAGQMQSDSGAANSGGHSFASLDANGNGQISWSEAKEAGVPHSNFKAADGAPGSGDGALTQHEYKTATSHWAFYGSSNG